MPTPLEAIPRHAWLVLGVSSMAVFVVFLDTTIVNIAFPAISREFSETSEAGLSWVLNAYSIVFAALLVTTGRLADMLGRRRLFLVGLAVFAATSALCGLAPTTEALVGARALQAVGAALLVPSSLGLLLPEFPVSRRTMAVSLWGAMGALAAATGPTIGALLVDSIGWRFVFLVNLPVCAAAVVLGLRLLTEARDPSSERRLDPLGVILVSATMGALALAIVQGPEWGWSDARVLAAFAAAAILAPTFLWRSAHHPAPIVDLSLFAVRSYSVANLATLVFCTGFFASVLNNVLFLSRVWGYSPLRTGLAVSPAPILAFGLAAFVGRFADRHGHRSVIVPGAVVYALAQLWFVTQVTERPAYLADFLPGFVLLGVGIGLTFATLGGASASSLPPQRFALGSAVNATARQFGAVLGVSMLIAILSSAPGLDGAERAWTAIGVLSLATAAIGLLLTRPMTGPSSLEGRTVATGPVLVGPGA